MADDRMKDDDLQRNMGGNREDQGYGQQSPGKTGQGQSGKQAGQHAGGQQSGGQFGGQKGTQKHQMEEDDDLNTGRGQGGMQNRGAQNR